MSNTRWRLNTWGVSKWNLRGDLFSVHVSEYSFQRSFFQWFFQRKKMRSENDTVYESYDQKKSCDHQMCLFSKQLIAQMNMSQMPLAQ